MRGLLLAAIVGFPIVIISSWLYDLPWQRRRWIAVAGDVAVILSIVVAASLLALRQWTTGFSKPTVAILPFVATDTHDDTDALGRHLSGRLRDALSLQPDLLVIESYSAHNTVLLHRPTTEIAERLGADLLVRGTVNQDDSGIRLTLRLLSADGEVKWIEQFEDRLLDLQPLQSAVLNGLWLQLPLPDAQLAATRSRIASCDYPDSERSVRTLLASHTVEALSNEIEDVQHRGLLFLARARLHAAAIDSAPGTRRPVLQALAMSDLDAAAAECPQYPFIRLQRLHLSQTAQTEIAAGQTTLDEFPNDARILMQAAALAIQQDRQEHARSLAAAAARLDPMNPAIIEQYGRLREAQGR